MWHHFVTKNVKNQGFTLLETLIMVTIASTLAVTAVPNFLSWQNQNKVKSGIQTVAGALQEVKRQVKQQNKQCTLILDNDKIKSNIAGCLSNSRKLPGQVTLATNIAGTPPALTFSHKGNLVGLTTDDPDVNIGVIVVSLEKGTNQKQCLLISDGLGMVRTGFYEGDLSTITQDKCVVRQG